MLDQLSAWCIEQPAKTAAMTATLVLVALGLARQVNIEAFPDVTNPQVMVIALAPGMAAEEVEREVTLPIERALVGLSAQLMQRSITSFGLAQVIVTFDDDAPIHRARQEVAERLLDVELPEGTSARLGPNDTPVGQIFQYTLEGDGVPIDERRSVQEWLLEKHLLAVPGVADVVSFGGFVREYHVVVDAERAKSLEVGLGEVAEALRQANGSSSGGYLRQGDGEVVVRSRGYLRNLDDIGAVAVAMRGEQPVLVRHVAHVVIGHTPRRGSVARGSAHESVEGIVLLRRGHNPRQTLAAVRAKVDELNAHVLPRSLRIVPFYDRTTLVEQTLRTVSKNMVEGGLLVTAIIFVFLRSLSFALLVALIMPLALLSSFVGLWALHVPANLLSMGAIDFGILLDGGVILIERIFSHRDGKSAREQVLRAARQTVRPTLFSMAIIVVAMLPIFTLERVEGRIFRPMALTYVFALLGALLTTFTIIPALAVILLRRLPERSFHGSLTKPDAMARLEARYRRLLTAVLLHPRRFMLTTALLSCLALLWVPYLGSEFLPQMNEGDLHITVSMPSSIALEHGSDLLLQMRAQLMQHPAVLDVLTEQGHPEDGTDDEAPNQAKMIVRLHPQAQWPRNLTPAALSALLRNELSDWPGISFNFSQPIKDRVEEAISGVRGQVVIKAFGEDLGQLHEVLEAVAHVLGDIDGTRDVEIYRAGVAQHIVAEIDRERAAHAGVSVAQINATLRRALGGEVVTYVMDQERRIDVRLKQGGEGSLDPARIAQLMVARDGRSPVPLGQLATICRRAGRTQINREALSRFLALKCNVAGRDLGSLIAEAQQQVQQRVPLPHGVRLTWGGEFDNQRRAMRQLALVVPLTLGAIFVLLWATFAALMPAVVVLAGLPCATIGGIFALGMTQTPLSVSAAIGLITLLGVATMDGILLVGYAREALDALGENPTLQRARDALAAATSKRLRPVLMTALLASLGLVPAAMSHEIGSDTQRPFAIVIIGGLLSATALTLLVMPSLYFWVWCWRRPSSGAGLKRR